MVERRNSSKGLRSSPWWVLVFAPLVKTDGAVWGSWGLIKALIFSREQVNSREQQEQPQKQRPQKEQPQEQLLL